MSKRARRRKEKQLEEKKAFEQAMRERRREELAWVRRVLKWIGLGVGAGVVILLLVWGGIKLVGYVSDNFGDIEGPFGEISREELAQYRYATLTTSEGDIKLELMADSAPKTVANFVLLARSGFYDGVKFHRVIDDFMIQTGDPNSKDDDPSDDGTGGPGYQFDDEFNKKTPKLVRGAVAMANAGVNTNGSQFFIITAEATDWLDGQHTPFAKVVAGMDVVDIISKTETDDTDRPMKDIIVESITLSKE